MPRAMVEALIERNITAEYCTIKQILESAVNWEWQENVRARYAATRAAHRGEPRAGYYTGNRRPEARREGPRIAAADREEIKHKLYRIVRRDPAMKDEARAHEVRAPYKPYQRPMGRDGGGNGGVNTPRPYPGGANAPRPYPKPAPPGIKCFKCGGPHYKNDCTQPQERGFAAREAVDDRSEPADSSSKPRIEALTPPSVRSEQMRRGYEEPVEDENPYMGEQYESEGEFTWEEVSEYSDYANDERCAHAIEDWEDLPALGDEHSDEESDSESDSRSEEDDNMAEVPGRPGVKPVRLGLCDDRSDEEDECEARTAPPMKVRMEPSLFATCDEWPEHEFIGERELEKVARDMARHIIQQGDTDEVEEFLFATGDRDSLSPTQASRKRGVYMKRSKASRPRPARTKAENFCLTAYVNINGVDAFTLFDSGCTTEACSPDFCRVAGIKVFPIKSAITLQLGTAGSRSKINHGTIAPVKYDALATEEYWDIVNLDRFDAIVGTKYMRKHGISLDFEYNTIRIRGQPSTTLSEKEESSEVERRNAARRTTEHD
ncbi:hypothetical protein DFH09DRAFT_1346924 [Mycena vulgaris]|nr:hypothetical protein DFH09DRAFT_1346924 [Mycena vulgaris]